MGGFSGVFAWARATRLGKNTRLLYCSHMQKPRIHGKNQSSNHTCVSNINLAHNASIKLIKHGSRTEIRRKTVSFPYLCSYHKQELFQQGAPQSYNLRYWITNVKCKNRP